MRKIRDLGSATLIVALMYALTKKSPPEAPDMGEQFTALKKSLDLVTAGSVGALTVAAKTFDSEENTERLFTGKEIATALNNSAVTIAEKHKESVIK